MIWVGLLLIGAGTSDLVFSWLRRPFVPEIVGALLVLALALGCGLTSGASWACVLVVVALVVVWGQLVGWGFGRHQPGVPLTAGALALATCIALAPVDGAVGGPVGDWLDASGLAWAAADVHLVVVLGVLLVQLSTGNVVVRLVLAATDTVNPLLLHHDQAHDQAQASVTLKGGRLLGPMERLLIVGLGLAGATTAAAIVIAAKGLLRFPELQASRGATTGPGIHQVTEYFLVGSFVSWTVALAGLALTA